MSKLDDISEGIRELDFFDSVAFVQVFKRGNILRGIGELEFFNNIAYV